ncbi:hypothetical protein DL764_002194 [Monosporascus ibericus]|uniref:Uncharacterized protein n=1 Tax=Monosporascus ibericus TaxID=155417 RepID=A0A4Q4TR36_9PEZI|nr:hypothetical protein DL764_002194 [Monosporascus ibericus]
MAVIAVLSGRDGQPPASFDMLARTLHGLSSAAVQSARFSSSMAARSLGAREEKEKTYEECHPAPNIDLCQKSVAASKLDVIIPLSILCGLLTCLIATLFYLHMRRKKRDEEEWSGKDIHELDAYGLEVPGKPPNTYQRSTGV